MHIYVCRVYIYGLALIFVKFLEVPSIFEFLIIFWMHRDLFVGLNTYKLVVTLHILEVDLIDYGYILIRLSLFLYFEIVSCFGISKITSHLWYFIELEGNYHYALNV